MTNRNAKSVARSATALAVAGAAAAAVVATGAGTADAAPLPGAFKSKAVPGGKVSIRLFNEAYAVQNSVANNPFSREVFVSGKVRINTSGDIKGGTVTAGYLVGCQLNFGAKSGGDIIGESDWDGNGKLKNDKTKVGASFTLSPGDVKFAPVIRASVGGEAVESFSFTGNTGGVAYKSERFAVDGCAGFAEARALVNVQVSTKGAKSNITLYGRPFSIG